MAADEGETPADQSSDPTPPPDLGDVYDELQALREVVDTETERELVDDTIEKVLRAERRTFGRVVYGFDRSDAAEALLGSLLFGIPMFVEGGTLEVGQFVSTHPLYFLATLTSTLGTVVGILYVADIQDVRIRNPLFGLIPRKLLGVVGVASLTAVAMMTVWGRVDWAGAPWLAACQVTVALFPMAIGAALGDLLPGS